MDIPEKLIITVPPGKSLIEELMEPRKEWQFKPIIAGCTCTWSNTAAGASSMVSRDPKCPTHWDCTCLWKTQEPNWPQHGRKEIE